MLPRWMFSQVLPSMSEADTAAPLEPASGLTSIVSSCVPVRPRPEASWPKVAA